MRRCVSKCTQYIPGSKGSKHIYAGQGGGTSGEEKQSDTKGSNTSELHQLRQTMGQTAGRTSFHVVADVAYVIPRSCASVCSKMQVLWRREQVRAGGDASGQRLDGGDSCERLTLYKANPVQPHQELVQARAHRKILLAGPRDRSTESLVVSKMRFIL